MKRVPWREWLWQYVAPIVVLQLSFGAIMLLGLGGRESDVFWFVFVMPVLAILMGAIFRPEWTLAVAAGFVILLWFPTLFLSGPSDPIGGPGVILLVLLGLVGLPLWFMVWAGQRIRPWLDERFFSSRDKPGMPAGY